MINNEEEIKRIQYIIENMELTPEGRRLLREHIQKLRDEQDGN